MKRIVKEKTPLIVFSVTLALLIAVSGVIMLVFAGSSNEPPEDVSNAYEFVGNGVVKFQHEPTAEEVSEALEAWTQTFEDGKNKVYDEPERVFYDISAYVEADDPASIYKPVDGVDYGIDPVALVRERFNQGAYKINKAYGVVREVRSTSERVFTTEFKVDHSEYVSYQKETMEFINVDTMAGSAPAVTECYANETTRVRYDLTERKLGEVAAIVPMNREAQLPGGINGILFSSTVRLLQERAEDFQVKDYGTYLGRNAVRITCTESYEEKYQWTHHHVFEFIIDIETNCNLATICYDRDGKIVSYTILTEFVTDVADIAVPLYVG